MPSVEQMKLYWVWLWADCSAACYKCERWGISKWRSLRSCWTQSVTKCHVYQTPILMFPFSSLPFVLSSPPFTHCPPSPPPPPLPPSVAWYRWSTRSSSVSVPSSSVSVPSSSVSVPSSWTASYQSVHLIHATFQSNCAEGLHFSAFHYIIIIIIVYRDHSTQITILNDYI